MSEVQSAWQSDVAPVDSDASFAIGPIDSLLSSEGTQEDVKSDIVHSTCLLLIAVQALTLGLLAAHAGASGAEHALFYTCDAVLALGFVCYVILRCVGRLGTGSSAAVCGVYIWTLSLLLSISAPSQRRQLLGIAATDDIEACEEGSAVLWIALLLTAGPVLAQFPPRAYLLLGLLVSVQHLVFGLIWERPECSSDRVPPGGPGGPLLGLPPIWVSVIQLSLISLLLAAAQWRLAGERSADAIITDYLEDHSQNKARFLSQTLSETIQAQNRVERIIKEIEQEEHDCYQLLQELQNRLPRGHLAHSARLWAALVGHLAGTLARCGAQLKCRTEGNYAHVQLFSAMEDSWKKNGKKESASVAGWLQETWTPNRPRASSDPDYHKSHSTRTPVTLQKVVCTHKLGDAVEGDDATDRVGEWDFDAIACDKQQKHVLQIMGLALLRGFPLLPKVPLRGFLDQLERLYVSTNAYHSHIHAADMVNSFYYLANKSGLWHLGEFSDTIRVGALIAGLGHDVGHFGKNNIFLTSTRHDIAVTYNDRSVLESFHASTLNRLLAEEYGEPAELRAAVLSALPIEKLVKARRLIITLILGTDTQHHLEDLSSFRVRLGANSFDPLGDPTDQEQSLAMLFRSADIGHSAKEWFLHEKWSLRVVQEFHEQGDEEKKLGLKVSPLCEREGFVLCTSQMGFLQFICLPTWKELARFEEYIHGMQREAKLSTLTKPANSPRGRLSVAQKNSPRRDSTGHDTDARPSPNHRILKARGTLMLPGTLPGAMPSAQQGDTAESDRRKSSKETDESDMPLDSTMWLSEVCLNLCEKNFQSWKSQVPKAEGAT